MINIENAKKEILNHIKQVKIDNPRVETKAGHILRVAQNCKKIAIDLNLTEEQVQLAELIGLLHDIGRFEQYKFFEKDTDNKVLDNTKKFDHGQAGVDVLRNNQYIRKYIKDNKYDDIIYKAIFEHNKYQLSEGLSKEKKLFCELVKDADKLDLLYEAVYIYWQDSKRIAQVEEGKLSKQMLEDFYLQKLANSENRNSETDQILRFASFVFDINFLPSFQILKENDNISKMIDRFNYKIEDTKEQMQKVKILANKYIEQKIKG